MFKLGESSSHALKENPLGIVVQLQLGDQPGLGSLYPIDLLLQSINVIQLLKICSFVQGPEIRCQ